MGIYVNFGDSCSLFVHIRNNNGKAGVFDMISNEEIIELRNFSFLIRKECSVMQYRNPTPDEEAEFWDVMKNLTDDMKKYIEAQKLKP